MALDFHYNVYGCHRPPEEDLELAKAAADAGFGGIWIGDHFMPWIESRPYTHHPFAWLATFLAEVPDVPVGTSVTCPSFRYRPPLIAQTVATLDHMYPGRFNLGVGVGEALNEAHFLDGEWPDWNTRAGMLIEGIDVMKQLWDRDEYIEYAGEFLSYDGIRLHTRPKADIDLHWAAWGPTSSEYAGRFAGNLLTATTATNIAETIVPRFEEGLEQVGRSRSDGEVTTEFGVNVGDPAKLVADIRERGEHVPVTELDDPDPRSIQTVANERIAEMSDEEVRQTNRITEDTEEILEWLREYDEAGVDRVLVGSNCGDPYRTIEVFEEEIIPNYE